VAHGGGLEDLYLRARYACTALQLRLGGHGGLGEALRLLCGELRSLLAEKGYDRVPRTFPRELLGKPTAELLRECLSAAEELARRGSRAAGLILEAVEAAAREAA